MCLHRPEISGNSGMETAFIEHLRGSCHWTIRGWLLVHAFRQPCYLTPVSDSEREVTLSRAYS